MIRFEHLVGPAGGGDVTAQRRALRAIARHVGVRLWSTRKVRDNLFGGRGTFQRGMIGTWREHANLFATLDDPCSEAGRYFGS